MQPAASQPGQPSPARSKVRPNPREQAWRLLESACASDKTTNRATAVLVLGLIPNNKRSAELAEKALTDSKPEVRSAAAAALGEMRSRASIPKLRAAFDDQDPFVVLAAAHSLDLMHDNSAYEVYFEVLNGERKAGKGLISSQASLLHDPKSPVRAAAAKVLARDPDPATTEALIDATGDKSWIVQTAALEALAKRGDRSALKTVEKYMSDEKDAVKYTAAAAVLRLGAIKASNRFAPHN
jgi:HEAT repeat protein